MRIDVACDCRQALQRRFQRARGDVVRRFRSARWACGTRRARTPLCDANVSLDALWQAP